MAEVRFEQSAAEYLAGSHLELYLADCVETLLASRDERPLEAIAEYLGEVCAGRHVSGREFSFCNASPHNRASLMSVTAQSLKRFDGTMPLSATDFHQLVCLLCPDFPRHLVMEAATLLSPSEPSRLEQASFNVHVLLEQVMRDSHEWDAP
eukprot:TRINITY_DN6914_c0_g1_i3.p2 TRINITY_DN6914_c0_g1~~TRINITY_DN6914_c0_g1_i3.p2  ORF type:complete len:151 (+),score=37.97 TRINITY_DN6914_c0_g1_i3:225-677(+)